MKLSLTSLLILLSIILIPICESARILAIIAMPSYSHQVAFRPIWRTLHERGHHIVLCTTNPMNDSTLKNLTEIDLHETYSLIKDMNFVKYRYKSITWLDVHQEFLFDFGNAVPDYIFSHPEFRKIYKDPAEAEQKFDLLIVQVNLCPACYAIGYKLKIPVIGVFSLNEYSYHNYMFGGPLLSSHPAVWELGNVNLNPPFWHRLRNFLRMWSFLYNLQNVFYPKQNEIVKKYFGKDVPHISELEKNISILLVYRQNALSFIKPEVPNIIPFGGAHILKEVPPLPQDLDNFLKDAPEGFIYVSFGSTVKMALLPGHVRRAFVDVLSKLPCKVVWKLEVKVEDKPDNVYISKWFPQASLLAHPKIRLFVYQGGIQSTEEAVHYAVPLVGMPIGADQDMQIFKLESLGVARRIELTNLTREDLDEAIRDVLTNKKYKENMIALRNLTKDKPYDALSNAIWWIEFVIRHKGAPHLRTATIDEPWYKRSDMDIIAFLSVAIFSAAVCILIMIYKCALLVLYKRFKVPKINGEKKIN